MVKYIKNMRNIKKITEHSDLVIATVEVPETGVEYPFVQSKIGVGDSIAILPFRLKEGEDGQEAEFLVRREWVPCWGIYEDSIKQPYFIMAAISDSIASGGPTNAAIKILRDQSGYQIQNHEVLELGSVFMHKSFSGMCYLYSVDLTKTERHKPSKDNALKNMGEAFWTDEKTMIEIGADPILHAAFARILQRWV